MADRAAGKTYTTIIFEGEDAAQRFKEFVLGGRERGGGRRPVWATSRSSSRRYLPKPVADLSMSSIQQSA
jgi:hypothetical protein